MKKKITISGAVLILAAAVLMGPYIADRNLSADDTARAVFAVHCYDVGKLALQGQKGVIKVKSGWHKSFEVNIVDYDPEKITVEKMQNILKEEGTYIKTFMK